MQATIYKIDDIVQGLFDGPHATPKPSNKGAIFLGINNITPDGKLDLTDIKHISEEDLPNWTKRVTPLPGDIVFTYEATLNRYAIIPKGFRGCLGRRLALIRVNSTKANNRFLYYYFLTNDWRSEVDKHLLSGSTVDRIPLSEFPNFFIKLPDKQTQDKIANIVGNYDFLIENNEKRIKILEEMAQRLYTEWFVKFKFPGNEKVKMVDSDSEFGLIPEGWKIVYMKEIAGVIDCLHTKKPKSIATGNNILLQLNNILDNGLVDLSEKYLISDEDYRKWTKNIELKQGDCVVTNVGRIAASAQIPKGIKVGIGRNMTAIRPTKIPSSFLIQYLKSPHMFKEVKRKIDAGAIMGSLNVKNIYLLKLILPTQNILESFSALSLDLRQQMEMLHQNNFVLKNMRDLLIPQLVTGKRELNN